MPVDYSRTAHIYPWVERLVFGNKLQRARTAYLETLSKTLPHDAHVLLIGDGDGRFLAELMVFCPQIHVTYVEPSTTMLEIARKRVPNDSGILWVNETIENWSRRPTAPHAPYQRYRLVISHFVFDSLSPDTLPRLIAQIVSQMTDDGQWIITDFDATVSRKARCLVALMYGFFALLAGVPMRKLGKFNSVLEKKGLSLYLEKEWFGRIIYSQLWQKTPASHCRAKK